MADQPQAERQLLEAIRNQIRDTNKLLSDRLPLLTTEATLVALQTTVTAVQVDCQAMREDLDKLEKGLNIDLNVLKRAAQGMVDALTALVTGAASLAARTDLEAMLLAATDRLVAAIEAHEGGEEPAPEPEP